MRSRNRKWVEVPMTGRSWCALQQGAPINVSARQQGVPIRNVPMQRSAAFLRASRLVVGRTTFCVIQIVAFYLLVV